MTTSSVLQIKAKWLLEWAERAGMEAGVATAAARTVLMGGSNDEVAAELFDLIGDGGFEVIQELVTYRSLSSPHVTHQDRSQLPSSVSLHHGVKHQVSLCQSSFDGVSELQGITLWSACKAKHEIVTALPSTQALFSSRR
jgi:hypothetical protein